MKSGAVAEEKICNSPAFSGFFREGAVGEAD